jgi:cyclomaltodextrinase
VFTLLVLAAPAAHAQPAAPDAATTDAPRPDVAPTWAAGAVWYQIFPERFANGDPSNDPTPESLTGAWPHVGADALRAAGWAPTPWTHDWTTQEPWARRLAPGQPYTTVFLRRYGGDVQGIIDRLEYLEDLGVTALYLNPLNDSPSLHKYDAADYRHVDPDFGPDPAGDRAAIAREDLLRPETWAFTSADRLFLDLIRAAHARGMRVVLDYSWNHTGLNHPAFQSVLQEGEASPFAGWYRITRWDDPATADTSEFAYSGWAGVPELPEWREVDSRGDTHAGIPLDGDLVDPVAEHVFAVSRRWLDPDGDGDPADGVDGYRLDVAEMVPLGFWSRYRDVVKAVNPEALIVGEIWWQQWPTTMMDPAPYLGVFDGVMHYRPFEPLRRFVLPGGPRIAPAALAAHLDSVWTGLPADRLAASWAMSGSHDTPRLLTTLANPQARYKVGEGLRETPAYWGSKPGPDAERALRLYRVLQFTLPGAPVVYYGDEAGMWGADDPDNRRPMLWPDTDYEPEAGDALGRAVRPAEVAPDQDLVDWHGSLARLRTAHAEALAGTSVEWLVRDDARGLLVYRRGTGDAAVTVAVNVSDETQTVAFPDRVDVRVGDVDRTAAGLTLGPRSAAVAAP